MSWLYEQQLIIVVLGVSIILALGAAWSASGRKELLYAVGVAIALLIAGLITERLVVTDREAIHATLLQIARDVQSNDRRAIVSHIHPSAPELKKRANAELPNYHFDECRVTKVNLIDVDRHAEPRSAMVELNIIVSGMFRVSDFEANGAYPRWVKLHMLRENDGRWTVVDYEHAEPQRMIMKGPTDQRDSR